MEVRELKRFADYFAVCGLGKNLEPNEKNATVKDPLSGRFKAEILDRFPATNYDDAPLPPHVWMFCFPGGVILRDSPHAATFFIFALTELDGARFYGAALTYYEQLPERLHQLLNLKHKAKIERTTYYAPTCICILSHYPFYSIFREFLRYLYLYSKQTTVRIPIERIISNLILDVPLPIPGVSRVRINLGEHILHLSKPLKRHFPLADFTFNYLFQSLGIYQTVQLFGCILVERKIIFISKELTMLTIAAEGITHLMYPFYWHHVYIPILPVSLCDFLQAPTPFIMGLHPEYYREPIDLTDIVIVDLDKGTLKIGGAPPPLPERETNQLLWRLRQLLTPDIVNLDSAFPSKSQRRGAQDKPNKSIDMDLRESFLGFFVSLFPAYREYMSFLRRYPHPIAIFHKARYLKARPDAVKFLSDFLETQAFAVFLEKHHQLSNNIFDEAAQAYAENQGESMWESFAMLSANRGKVRETIEVKPPDLSGLDITATYPNYGFTRLHHDLFSTSQIPTGVSASIPTATIGESPFQPKPLEVSNRKLTEDERFAEEFVIKYLDTIFSVQQSPPQKPSQYASSSQAQLHYTQNGIDSEPPTIDPAQKALLYDLFRLDYVRKIFGDKLAKQKLTGVFHVSDWAFELLVEMIKIALTEANKTADFRTPAVLMPLVATFYRVISGLPEFLQNQLQDLDIWKNSHFWEAAFFESIEAERKKLPEYVQDGQLVWASLTVAEQKEVIDAEENVIFSVLGSYANYMLNLGVDAGSASQFITRMSSLSLLTEEHTATLHALIKNINRVVTLAAQQNLDSDGAELLTAPTEVPKKKIFNNRQQDYFTSSMSKPTERDEAKELYQRIVELRKKDGPKKGTHSSYEDVAPTDEPVPAAQAPKEPEINADKRDGYLVKTLKAHCGGIDSMIIQEKHKQVICGTASGAVCVWSYADPANFVAKLGGHTDRVSCLAADKNDNWFASGSHDKTVRLWAPDNAGNWDCTHTYTQHTESVCCIEMHGTMVISGANDNVLQIFDTRSPKVVGTLAGHSGAVMCVQFDPGQGSELDDGIGIPYVISGSRDTSVKVWDLRTQKCIHSLNNHHDWVRRVAFDNHRIVSCSFDCTLKVWDIVTGKMIKDLSGHTGSVNCFQYSPKTSLLASGSGDGTIKIWDIDSGLCLKTLKGHTDEVICLNFDEEKSRLASGSFDQSVRLWDINTGKCDKVLRGHTDWVYSLYLLGNRIFTGSWDNTTKIWDVDDSLRRSGVGTPVLSQRALVTALNLSSISISPSASPSSSSPHLSAATQHGATNSPSLKSVVVNPKKV